MTDIDNRYKISDVIPSDGKKHNLNIRAYASGDIDDVLSYIIVFRNGKIFKLWDIREQKLRTFKQTLSIIENERAWYIVKVYGKNAWKNHSSLDVMRVCEKIKGDSHEYREGENDVAISSPFYFWRKEDKDPSILQSKINLTVTGPDGKIPAEQVTLEILSGGKTINSIKLSGGKSQFSMPVNGILKISAKGFPTIYRSLYIDYPPHQKILEDLASGRWMNNYDSTLKFNPGEVPWKEFQFEKVRKILSDVQWTIEMTPNERDHLWQDLDALFNDKKSGSKQNK
jgi:hypothetical protein